MNQFQGAGEREEGFLLGSEQLPHGQGEDRADPFPSGEDAVLHRLKKLFRILSTLSQESVEGTVNESLSLFQVGMDVHDGKGLFFFPIDIVLAKILQGLELKLPLLILDQKLYLAFDFSELLITQFY